MRRVSKKRQAQRDSPEGQKYDRHFLFEHLPWCWGCGRDEEQQPRWWHRPWLLERAHLAAGSGKMTRVEDRRGVVLLCSSCHYVHVHSGKSPILVDRAYRPVINDGNMLWLKRERDPEFWDQDWIAEHWIGDPPEPEELHWLAREYDRRRGW